ncbi:LCP family protein [Streptomyces sp. NBC_00893]|uniref:LCP family protein n=1 Tax=Streptomyces sp. NBC_00893 TaxID=2975862 RepID=UPI002252E1E5|nr:LCP family protein [Streptomyces sp. NBC_00893]MCX4847605.1 LCP family protein [Streptomyces sp. NBC_00893]
MRMVTGLSVLVLGAGGVGHAVVTSLENGIDRIDPFKDMKNRPRAGNGMNLLLVGTDGRDRISPEEKRKYRLGGAPCHCTDTVMLVHLSADRERASVVSLPRDSYAEVPGHTDRNTGEQHSAHPVKLNAAYAEGGPNLTVRTVEHMTGVKIDHYLEVDFTSFMKTVDALDGVKICTTRPLKDSYTGLDLAPGAHELNGGQALQYVRSRHIDGAADLGRMQRQQKFLASLIERATSSGVLLNPVKFRGVASTMLGSVRADKGFGTEQMLELGQAMRGFSPASSEFASVPMGNVSYPVNGIGSTVKWDETKSEKLFRALREDKPLAPARPKEPKAVKVDVAPRQIRVQVYNGTPKDGLGKTVDDGLHATGFDTTRAPLNGEVRVNGEPRGIEHTLITYDPRWDRSAKSLAAALPGAELRAVPGQGATMRVTAGADFEKVRRVRAEESDSGEFETVTGDQVACP